MGIFLVMMTIMMQFFTSAQQVWNAASKRNIMYADARVAMNIMTRELQSMLYRNDGNDLSGSIYPFWLEWTETNVDLTGTESITSQLEDHWVDNKDLPEKVIGVIPKDAYLTALNFISTTDLKSVDEGSDVCEIRYKFIPVYFTSNSPASANDVKGGKLQRSCVAEYSATGIQSLDVDYNFADCHYRGANPGTGIAGDPGYPYDERVLNIWKDSSVTPDPTPFQTVISGVYSLRFTCYFWNSTDADASKHFLDILMVMNSLGKNISGTNIITPLPYNLAMGTPAPVAVRIDMKLMAPKDLKKLAYNIYVFEYSGSSVSEKKGAEKQIRTLKQKMRTFSKVIYLGKQEN